MTIHVKNLPSILTDRKQWVLWRKERRKGKDKKVPYHPNGKRASTTNPNDWARFAEVQGALHRKPGFYDGIGYVFAADDPCVGIDIDHVNPADAMVQAIVKRFDSYAEISQSGQGVHIIIQARKTRHECEFVFKGLKFEVYAAGRYFAMTGTLTGATQQIHPRQEALDALYARAFHAEPEEPTKPPTIPTADNLHEVVISVLEEYGSGLFEHYQDWLRLCYACKSDGLPYEKIDGIFRQSPRYNEADNRAIYDKLKPQAITFRTAYHYALQANELEVRRRLNPHPE
jgi:hypothetical protein